MKLVDWDKVKISYDKQVSGAITEPIYNLKIEAPEVKAIPIEWINSYTTGLIFSDEYVDNADSIDDYIYCIKEMVRDWEKENEK